MIDNYQLKEEQQTISTVMLVVTATITIITTLTTIFFEGRRLEWW